MEKYYDAIIIGKGPAGISAALYIARAKKSVLVIGKDFGALEKAHKIENYYGLEKPLSGIDLAKRGIDQAQALGITVLSSEVTALSMLFPEDEKTRARFSLKISSQDEELYAQSILIATGKERTGLKLPGFEEFKGKGISFCATCDGFFYKNKKIGVIGDGAFAAEELNYLYNLTKDITLFTNGKEITQEVKELLPDDITIISDQLTNIKGTKAAADGGVVKEILAGEKSYEVTGIFVALGTAGATSFAAHLGLAIDTQKNQGSLSIGEDFSTTIPGIYAAGDAVGGLLQVAKAVSDGAIAGSEIAKELRKRNS